MASMDRLRLSADAQSAGLANFKEEVQLRRSISELDRGRGIVGAAILAEQAVLFRRYNRRLAATRLAQAKRGGDREAAQHWRRRLLSASPAERERERRDLQSVLARTAHSGAGRRVATSPVQQQRSGGCPNRLLQVAERQAASDGPRSLLELHRQRTEDLRLRERLHQFCDGLRHLRLGAGSGQPDYYAQQALLADEASGKHSRTLGDGDEATTLTLPQRKGQRPLTSTPRNLTFRSVTMPF